MKIYMIIFAGQKAQRIFGPSRVGTKYINSKKLEEFLARPE